MAMAVMVPTRKLCCRSFSSLRVSDAELDAGGARGQ